MYYYHLELNINPYHQYQLFYQKKSFSMTISSHGRRNHWKWSIPFIQFWGQCTSNVVEFIRKSIILSVFIRSKFGESFVRVVVFGLSKFPSGQLVVDTGVFLRSDEENFIHILDLWSTQVQNIKELHQIKIAHLRQKHSNSGSSKYRKKTLSLDPWNIATQS